MPEFNTYCWQGGSTMSVLLGALGDSGACTTDQRGVVKDSWYLPILQTRVGNRKFEELLGQGFRVTAPMTMQTADISEALDDKVPVYLGEKNQ